jgi:hypothetical protein
MNDEAGPEARPASTTPSPPIVRPAPVVTPLQIWVTALVDLLTDAGNELTGRELATFYDIALHRVARDAVAVGLDEWRRAA